jgi:hypothetical protein
MLPAGVFRFTLTGIGTPDMNATAVQIVDAEGNEIAPGAQGTLNLVTALNFQNIGASSFTEGTRAQGGQRYVSFSYRIRNNTGGPISNLTLIPNTSASTIAGTPFISLLLFNGSAANSAIAAQIVPTGSVALDQNFAMISPYPDVIQAFTEAEVAAIVPPAGVTGFFPYGFVVRNRLNPNTRVLSTAVDANDYGGVLTFAFRYPMQATSTADPFTITFDATAFQDTETRVTESIEEGQDPAAVTRLRNLATALAATTTSVLNGSSAMDAAVPDYPGQRQICSVRTAGTSGSPVTFINNLGAYTKVTLLYPGETMDPCAAYFRSGTVGRPATNVAFPVQLRATDRYGNTKTVIGASEPARLEQTSGPAAVFSAPTTFAAGVASTTVTFTDYGASVLAGVALRLRDTRPSSVFGITRTWTAGAGTTNWNTGGNWDSGAVPMSQDSVYIPAAAPLDPALVANVAVEGVIVEDIATIALGAFNLTANANVTTGTSGGITNSSGQLILTGTAKTIQGVVPRIRVTGTYSLTANLTARAPIQVDAGRLTASGFRVQASSN